MPPAHQVQLINYLCTICWLDYGTALPKSHFSFLLIWRHVRANPSIVSCTVFIARLDELKVIFPGIPRLSSSGSRGSRRKTSRVWEQLSHKVRDIWADSGWGASLPLLAHLLLSSLPLVCRFLLSLWPWWKVDAPQFLRLDVSSLSSQQRLVWLNPNCSCQGERNGLAHLESGVAVGPFGYNQGDLCVQTWLLGPSSEKTEIWAMWE